MTDKEKYNIPYEESLLGLQERKRKLETEIKRASEELRRTNELIESWGKPGQVFRIC